MSISSIELYFNGYQRIPLGDWEPQNVVWSKNDLKKYVDPRGV